MIDTIYEVLKAKKAKTLAGDVGHAHLSEPLSKDAVGAALRLLAAFRENGGYQGIQASLSVAGYNITPWQLRMIDGARLYRAAELRATKKPKAKKAKAPAKPKTKTAKAKAPRRKRTR